MSHSQPPLGAQQIYALSIWKCMGGAYLAKSLKTSDRVSCFTNHYQLLLDKLKPAMFDHLMADDFQIWTAGPYQLTAKMEHVIPNEGELTLHFKEGTLPLYGLSFSFVPGSTVAAEPPCVALLSRMQGWNGQAQRIREASRFLGDVTPQMVSYYAFVGVSRAMGVRNLFGVLAANQVCYRHDRHDLFSRAYDAFYDAIGARSHATGFTELPDHEADRPLCEIARWHRRRTKTRRAMKRELVAAIEQTWLSSGAVRLPAPA